MTDVSPPEPVRRRASQRKGRVEEIVHRARRPAQKRSADRFDLILAATEALLETADIEDISFHDIARQANLPPASVHYLFPTMASMRIELFRIYNARNDTFLRNVPRSALTNPASWQQRVADVTRQLRDIFNASRPMSEVVLGPALHREARLAAIENNDETATAALEGLCAAFIVPEIPGLLRIFQCNSDLVDALWSRSYLRHGRIDDEALADSVTFQVASLRTLLPEVLHVRDAQF